MGKQSYLLIIRIRRKSTEMIFKECLKISYRRNIVIFINILSELKVITTLGVVVPGVLATFYCEHITP